ncbi:MAG: class I SAM-dependent methyltransferase [Firmicutes bacterium]|nr:class I SAM-dependent methyltransferase [Bacillota bacterium]
MAHKFNPNNKGKLDDILREREMPPKETLKKLYLKKGEDVLDIGCGIGYFTMAASEIIGDNGKVYATDVSRDMLKELEIRLHKKRKDNVKVIKGFEYDTDIEETLVDFILISNVLHEVEDKKEFLNNYLKKLKNGGKLAIIEWKKTITKSGPPYKERIDIKKLLKIFKEHNIEIIKDIDLTDTHYGVVGIKR